MFTNIYHLAYNMNNQTLMHRVAVFKKDKGRSSTPRKKRQVYAVFCASNRALFSTIQHPDDRIPPRERYLPNFARRRTRNFRHAYLYLPEKNGSSRIAGHSHKNHRHCDHHVQSLDPRSFSSPRKNVTFISFSSHPITIRS